MVYIQDKLSVLFPLSLLKWQSDELDMMLFQQVNPGWSILNCETVSVLQYKMMSDTNI